MRSHQLGDVLCAAVLSGSIVCSACSDRPAKKSDVTPADVVAGRVKTFEHFESPNGKFAIDFPEVWRGAYTVGAHTDATGGARMAVEFIFKPDVGWKTEARPLLVIRIFTKAAWEKLNLPPGQHIAALLAAKGRFEEMMQSFLQDPAGLRLKPL